VLVTPNTFSGIFACMSQGGIRIYVYLSFLLDLLFLIHQELKREPLSYKPRRGSDMSTLLHLCWASVREERSDRLVMNNFSLLI